MCVYIYFYISWCRSSWIAKNQANMLSSKETNVIPELPEKKSNIGFKKVNKRQENIEKEQVKLGNQCMNKIISFIRKKKLLKGTKISGAEKYNDRLRIL